MMKKAAVILVIVAILILGLVFFGNFSGGDKSNPDPDSTDTEVNSSQKEPEDTGSQIAEVSKLTREEFDQLPQEEQDEMMEEYILDFWANELGMTEPNSEERNLSLAIFNRPYMQTITEKEFSQLSEEDQKKAIVEVMEDIREIRKYITDLKAEADSLMEDGDYKNAEAYYIYTLQRGREMSKDKDNMIITRLAGIACERAGLRGLVKLYEKTGENSNLEMASQQLQEIDEEMVEIRKTAMENEAKGVTDSVF